MRCKYNKNLTEKSRSLRKNMTKEERKLWYEFLKNYEVRFNRQKVLGKYIVDFYCAKARLVIELDGSQHYETPQAMLNDARREEFIEGFGVVVVRVTNNLVNDNFRGVCESLDDYIKRRIEMIEKKSG